MAWRYLFSGIQTPDDTLQRYFREYKFLILSYLNTLIIKYCAALFDSIIKNQHVMYTLVL